MDRLQLPRALKALIAMSKTPYDTPASTCALQNKTRKVLEGGYLMRHLTLVEYDKVCRDVSTCISRINRQPQHTSTHTPHTTPYRGVHDIRIRTIRIRTTRIRAIRTEVCKPSVTSVSSVSSVSVLSVRSVSVSLLSVPSVQKCAYHYHP